MNDNSGRRPLHLGIVGEPAIGSVIVDGVLADTVLAREAQCLVAMAADKGGRVGVPGCG